MQPEESGCAIQEEIDGEPLLLLGRPTALPASGSSSSGDAPASGFCAVLRPSSVSAVLCWRLPWKLPGLWRQRVPLPMPVPPSPFDSTVAT